MTKEDDLKEKSKMSLQEMFSTEQKKTLSEKSKMDHEVEFDTKYDVKVTWYLSKKNAKQFKDFYAWRTLRGEITTKSQLENEIFEFFMKHHKHLLKKNEKQ